MSLTSSTQAGSAAQARLWQKHGLKEPQAYVVQDKASGSPACICLGVAPGSVLAETIDTGGGVEPGGSDAVVSDALQV